MLHLSDHQAKELSSEEVFAKLGSSAEGLSPEEATRRLEIEGPNGLPEKKESLLQKLLGFFWGPIPWMIEVAALLSLFEAVTEGGAEHWLDFSIITVMLLINAVIGFLEEYKASDALKALKNSLALKARVKRGGAWQEVDAADLVPGDVIRLRLGDIVPGDAKLFAGDYLSIDEAALTGESLPVSKTPGDIVYSSSVAKRGEMEAVVIGTGVNTFFGRTARLVGDAGVESHFERAMMKINNFLILLSIALSVLLAVVSLHRGMDALALAQLILILLVASIPVAMPAVLSITMALGVMNLSKHKAIVSRIQAIEEMAGVDVLCSDKTGTLTQNKLTLGETLLYASPDEEDCILAAALASKRENNDAIDLAVLGAVKNQEELTPWRLEKFTPFDPVTKRTGASLKSSSGALLEVSKGAPQVMAELCDLSENAAEKVAHDVASLAARGLRALGVAQKKDGGAWEFLGILSLYDPPREDSAATIAKAREYGLDVKMVTGDDTAIAAEISGQLGMGTHIIPAQEFFPPDTDPDHLPAELQERIEKADGFARVFPEHKYAIVKALQARGHVVAMTGDGVNDAPALKQADAGTAVSDATDAARAAAALILTAPGLGVIIHAIEAARQIFARMMSYTIYRIAMTIDIMVFVVLSMLLFPTVMHQGVAVPFQPISTVMLILLALLDDIPTITLAYDSAPIAPTPQRWEMPRLLTISCILGALSVAQSFGLLGYCMHHLDATLWGVALDPEHIKSMVFLQLIIGGHLLVFCTRTQNFFFTPPYPTWPLVTSIFGTQLLAALLAGFGLIIPQLPWPLIGLVWLYNLIWMGILDFVKVVLHRSMDRKLRVFGILRRYRRGLFPFAFANGRNRHKR
jgi:H+-transporting ATPase